MTNLMWREKTFQLPVVSTKFCQATKKLWNFIIHYHLQLAIPNTATVYYNPCR